MRQAGLFRHGVGVSQTLGGEALRISRRHQQESGHPLPALACRQRCRQQGGPDRAVGFGRRNIAARHEEPGDQSDRCRLCQFPRRIAEPAGALPAPATPDPAALQAVGLRVAWPVAAATSTVQPGQRLAVAVRRLRRGAPLVRITLSRVSSAGRVLRRIAALQLRGGRAALTVPPGAPRHYALTLRAGALEYRTRLDTAKDDHDPTRSCDGTGGAQPTATMTLASAAIIVGGTLNYTVRNTSPFCLTGGYGGTTEHLVNGTWEVLPDNRPVPMLAFLIAPGETFSAQWTLLDTWGPGRYRFTSHLLPGTDASAEFDIIETRR